MGRRQPPGRLLGTDDQVTRHLLALATAALVAVTALSGCDDGGDDAASAPEPTAAAVSTRAPEVRACYDLDVAAGLELSSSVPAVRCGRRHTAVTVAVGEVRTRVKGTLIPLESARAQRQIASTCKAKVDRHVGGSTETRRLSRVQAVWFSPSSAQIAAGARWFRCDLVVAGTQANFTPLPKRTRGLLDGATALNRYGTCGTTAPGAKGFRRVACSLEHSWRARASIDLPKGTKYLAKAAGKAADSTCRDVEARRATGSTKLRWSFEWPTKAQWTAGQRYGLCWTPD